jgi:hypothetical protein
MGNPQINIYCLCNPHQPPCCGSEPLQHRTMRINTKHCVYRYASFLHGQPPRRMKRRRMLIPLGGYTYTILFTIIMSLCCTGSLSRLCPRGVQYNPVDMVSLQLPISKPAMLVSIQTVNNLSIPAYLLLSLHQTFYLRLKSPRGGFHPRHTLACPFNPVLSFLSTHSLSQFPPSTWSSPYTTSLLCILALTLLKCYTRDHFRHTRTSRPANQLILSFTSLASQSRDLRSALFKFEQI